uniref:DENN/MADD domain containing 1A n=1 Tax=Oncorhynchus mykiss TaxID=8022 RepID=A0A8K9Y3D1_ONCMY
MGSRIKDNPEATFEVYLEVTHPGTTGSDPEVRRRFPEDYIDQETLQTVPKFCFPFSVDSLSVSQVGQNFTFVLTDIESKQRFGFCRLSSGAHSCYCILSYLPWFEVFYKLLNILADYTIKGQESQWRELLESLHTLPIPDPGVPVHLSVRNLTEYFVAVDVNNMLHLYASMLYERRILICCSKLSTLTACVHGSAAMMYPMYWQHVYIPVLPQHLIDYCCAPMPYLIGVHSSLMEKVRGMALDDVVVLNVDTNTLETPFDDLQSLPNDVVSSLKNRLKKVSTTTGDGVARAFLKTQAALFGCYRNALQIQPGEPITFSEEVFVTHRSSAMRQFLQNAIQLQLFKQFIDGRLDLLNAGEGFSDVFEDEINMGEYAGSDKNYHQWLFTVKKGGGAIFNTVRTKANPAMKTVYKPPPYRSLKEAEEGEEPISGPSYTAPPSPVMEKFADINLLGNMFSCLDEPEGQQLSLAKSLEDLRTPKDPQEQQKLIYQRMDLSGTLPGLKHSNPYNKMWSMHGQDDMAMSGRVSPNWDRPLSVPPPDLEELQPPSRESFGPGVLERPDLFTSHSQGECITIPRPQGRKTPEPGKVLGPPPVPQPRIKPGVVGDGGTTTAGGQEFRQALGMGGDLMLQPTKMDFNDGEDVDLLSLLDPLNNPAQTTTTPALAGEGADSRSCAEPPTSRPVLPPRPYPQSLPPFHQHMPLNPFTPPLGYSTHRHYSPTVAGNPFGGRAYGPPASTYFHASPHGHPPHPLSTMLGLYRLSSPVGSTLPPGMGSMRSAFPNHGGPPPTSSGSHHALSNLLDSPSVPTPSLATRVLPKPPNTAEDSNETQDPFGDLLAMAKPAAAPPKKKVEGLRGKWETFD